MDLNDMGKNDWSNFNHILCIRPDNMGDVLMTQPAIRALKQQKKGRKITLLTSKMGAKIGRLLPEIDKIIEFDVPWIKTDDQNGESAVQQLVKRLKAEQFDAAAIFTNFSQNAQAPAMICYLAGISQILAYSRTNPYQLINHWVPDSEPFLFPAHGVKRQINMVSTVGADTADKQLALEPEKKAKKTALQKLKKEGVNPEKPWLILHPGVSEAKREYPVEMYGKAAEMLNANGRQIVITGLECENNLAAGVASSSKAESFNMAGKLSLKEFIALISLAPVIISNNTASVHIAAAVQTPVVDLYARTNPEHTPWMVKHRTLYFDVPQSLQSSNATLVHTTPNKLALHPQPEDIVTAVHELTEDIPLEKSNISSEKMSWSNEGINGTYTHLQSKRGAGRNAYQPLLSKLKSI
ncbi:MAG TPA: glycosyltransferase family 9 protein [Balneolaceae bacterium]|nr:glycosyltransferase family 9 protein [Balneolaceae bacterium]